MVEFKSLNEIEEFRAKFEVEINKLLNNEVNFNDNDSFGGGQYIEMNNGDINHHGRKICPLLKDIKSLLEKLKFSFNLDHLRQKEEHDLLKLRKLLQKYIHLNYLKKNFTQELIGKENSNISLSQSDIIN